MEKDERLKALDAAISQIEKQYGKGAVMKLGDPANQMNVETIPTGSLSLDIALGLGGIPKGRIVEIYGPESSGKTTVTLHMIAEVQKRGGIAGFIDAEHALDPVYAKNIGVDIDNLYISQPDNGEQALEITETMVRSGAIDIVVVDSVAALHEYGAPAIIIDMGTATTICVVDKNKNYIGGQILPGVRVSLDSLVSRTSQLPRIALDTPKKVIGTNTVDCMKSGILYGNASCIDGMIEKIEEELGYSAVVVATGGLAKSIIPYCRHNIILDDDLLLKGLKIIYDKNSKHAKNTP